MPILKDQILEVAGGERIEAVVIGRVGWAEEGEEDISEEYGCEGIPNYTKQPMGKVLTWDEAAGWLDYEYNGGFGAPHCNALWAWTANKVIAIGQYDGATWVYSIPRNPVDEMPTMEGG